jgi:2-polyprenyl-3-methyl-5-hydroxy-6-metoxy-1,4-benzoquinol methylase
MDLSLEGRFGPCEVCDATVWREYYRGPIRRGAFGNQSDGDTIVAVCDSCGAARLEEKSCEQAHLYQDGAYRRLVGEASDPSGYFKEHDVNMLRNLIVLWPESMRGKVVADIGCAAGSFLDHLRGLTSQAIAIEPCREYHASLAQRDYSVYASATEALRDWQGKVDYAFTLSVIEHVPNPREFLGEIRRLLKPGGRALISTPNRRDILIDLMPGVYDAFFYRTVHRWYFDVASLQKCAEMAGLKPVAGRFVQRFGLSNTLRWLRDRKPGGHEPLPHLDSALLDEVWRAFLAERGISDYLYLTVSRAIDDGK